MRRILERLRAFLDELVLVTFSRDLSAAQRDVLRRILER